MTQPQPLQPDFNNQAALLLAKANTDLMLKLCEIFRGNTNQMVEALQKNMDVCQKEFESSVRNSLSANNWTNMAMAWMNIPLLIMKHQAGQLQQVMESGVRAQLQSGTVIRDAVSSWQKDATSALQEGSASMPLSSTLRAFMDGYSLPTPFAPQSPIEQGLAPR